MVYKLDRIELEADSDRNFIQLDSEDFQLLPLTGKGTSSNLFILHDPAEETQDRVIKICKSPLSHGINARIKRFKREIEAFRIAKNKNLRGVITFYKAGEVEIDRETFLYIIMEKADSDLGEYLASKKFVFTINEKLAFCFSILNGLHQLHAASIYHRDIKHDNILLVNGEFKIGDLGLVGFRHEDVKVDKANDKIGPAGWLSPEATNKMLTFKKPMPHNYDCSIDAKSDIFQLGKLFWYIFQGNLPIGQVSKVDYKLKEHDVYEIIIPMLQYEKSRRPDISTLQKTFAPILQKYGI